MQLDCPYCQQRVNAKEGSEGELVCSDCGRPIPGSNPPTPPAMRPSTSRLNSAEASSSGIGQAISQKATLGPYIIMGELGRGGMGRVYKALHKTLRQVRAIKVLAKQESRHPKVLARFQREARIVAALNHPHIVKIFEFEKDPDRGYYYIVMEFVDGGSVARILRKKGKLPWQQAAEITLQVALGLGEMHRHNLVHRDIKPSNILIDKAGSAKLADLGLARHEGEGSDTQLTATGMVMGTIDYMAPEQIVDARRADIRSDLYGLGCTLFHMLAGQVPFPDGSAYQKVQQQIHDPLPEVGPLVPDIPFQLVLILNRLTEKDPANRYQVPEDLITDLEALIGEPQTDEFEASTILQLQALAEAAAKDRPMLRVGPGSTGSSFVTLIGRFTASPYWMLVTVGLALAVLLLLVLWPLWSRRS